MAPKQARARAQQIPVTAPITGPVSTIGVKRPGFGNAGRKIEITTNSFKVTTPDKIITHYDVILPSEKTLPARLNVEIITRLQTTVAPHIFSPRAVYDGRKNMFSAEELVFGNRDGVPLKDMGEFEVALGDATVPPSGKGPKTYKVRLTKVASIDPETLSRFLQGKQSHDNTVLTAITALNVVIRMEPTIKYPFNVRSFFTDRETKDIGGGLVLWRGYFQSVRPAITGLLINVDISTGTMFKPGPLIDLCLDFFGRRGQPQALSPKRGLPDRERLRLQRFIAGLRIVTSHRDETGRVAAQPRVIRGLSRAGAGDLKFQLRDGGTQTVADYFKKTYNKPLQHPDIMCVEVGSGALIPLELCEVPPGQIMRRQVPPEKTKEVLEFATKRPGDRLQSINNGLQVLAYGQSEYVRPFGLTVSDTTGALRLPARVLPVPTLKYGPGSREPTIQPRDGAWNMINKKFFQPCSINGWCVVVYEREQRFPIQACQDMIQGLLRSCAEVGITGLDGNPYIKYENGQGDIGAQLRSVGKTFFDKTKKFPQLIVVILPEAGTDIYTAVKHFGDIQTGVATQCLKSSKCFRAKPQYYANVCLKINVKLGGINTVPDPRSVPFLSDPANPTLILGADVIHPAPGSDGRPSFTSLVGGLSESKYIATSRCQPSRQEMIEDLEEMTEHIIKKYVAYRRAKESKASPTPKRIIYYRDGVSEGQFKTVLETEVPRIKKACEKLGINPLPKCTVLVVGKRHHVRFFPGVRDADRSGNCPAGTIVDNVVTNPVEFDWYLQSHGGLLGTSRPAHYNVLLDENSFQADGIQQLSFALCHVYARSTRSVSIPAPVYYADIVCARAKTHYDPRASNVDFSDSASMTSNQAQENLETFRKNFKPLHANAQLTMYFS